MEKTSKEVKAEIRKVYGMKSLADFKRFREDVCSFYGWELSAITDNTMYRQFPKSEAAKESGLTGMTLQAYGVFMDSVDKEVSGFEDGINGER